MSDHEAPYEVIRVEVARLDIHPGDKLLFRLSPESLSQVELNRVCQKILEFVGPEIPCVILWGNVEVSIIRREPGLFG